MTASNWKGMACAGAVAMATMIAGCAAQPQAPQPPATGVPNPGPQGGRGTPEGCQADKLGDNALIGKTEADAAKLLEGCAWRFGNREGQHMPGTMDYNPQRRTIDVMGGKVTAVRRG
ncbi:hypothetical protein [Cupriavidus sp. D384]|uniref:hypothetical protein n=1 Tax=Cupriavidus sp. D384 TaxID=1538095 RepID=UPI000836B4FC|nr:hypothetical protein [Cupriavidus sp. D384]